MAQHDPFAGEGIDIAFARDMEGFAQAGELLGLSMPQIPRHRPTVQQDPMLYMAPGNHLTLPGAPGGGATGMILVPLPSPASQQGSNGDPNGGGDDGQGGDAGTGPPIGPQGGGPTDLESVINRRQKFRNARERRTPYIRTYARGTGKLGNLVTLPPASYFAGDGQAAPNIVPVPLFTWRAQDEGEFNPGDDQQPDSQPLTISIQATPQASGAAYRPYVQIVFGTAGGPITVLVDASPGCQFTFAASAVTATCWQLPINAGRIASPISAACSVSVSASISFGATASQSQARQTNYISVSNAGVGPNLGTNLPVPTYTKTFDIRRATPATTALQIDFLDGYNQARALAGLTYSARYSVLVPAGSDPLAPEPIGGDIAGVNILDTVGNDSALVEVFWSLSL